MILLKDTISITTSTVNEYGENTRGEEKLIPCQFTGLLDKLEAIRSVAVDGVYPLNTTVWISAQESINIGDEITIKKVCGLAFNRKATVVAISHAGRYKGLVL